MSVSNVDRETAGSASVNLDPLRAGVSAALVLMSLAVLCWAAQFIGAGRFSHGMLEVFTTLEPASFGALLMALCWTLLSGFLAGAMFAAIYNMMGSNQS